MNLFVNRKLILLFCFSFTLSLTYNSLQAQDTQKVMKTKKGKKVLLDSLKTEVNGKEVKNRNAMLNASSSSMPRELNIGLPFTGDILIMENDLPVVYNFWTQIPTTDWRYDSTLGRMGVMSFAEGALTFGKVGYCVQSYDRDPGREFKGYAQMYVNSYAGLKYDAALTGPIKNGWGYMIGVNETYDRGSGTNYEFTPWQDRTQMFKAAITKKYNGGDIKLLYKHAESKPIMGSYYPITYEGNGKTKAVSGIKLGSDSYIVSDGLFPYYNYNTGSAGWANLNADSVSENVTDAIYLCGNNRFKNKMKLTYSAMYMHSKVPFTIMYPISLSVTDPDQRSAGEEYYYHGTSTPYNGSVQLISSQYYPRTDINTFLARAELSKKCGNHDLRVGMTYQYYNEPYISEGGLYYQTVEANPKVLDRYYSTYNITPNGLLSSTGMGSYQRVSNKKTALYFSDDLVLSNRISGGFGFRIENQSDREVHDPYINQFLLNRAMITKRFNNHWNKVGTANIVFKVTNDFGFLADATYNDWYNRIWDYPANEKDSNGNPTTGATQTAVYSKQQSVLLWGGGVYWNHGNLFSLVSKVTQIEKKNNVASTSIVNPSNTEEQATFSPLLYNIKTFGWTTDIISSPFKNFNIHYLLTLQKPQYENYKISAFGVTYDYDGKIIPAMSKVLMEIDPSYFLMGGDMRLWFSLRYFGKQYGNMTNSIYYNGWWENFGGVDYHMNRNITLKLQVVNFLNQRGVSGSLVGADQITDASSYVGRKIVAQAIRPRTIELTASFNF